uniref:Putative secreted protein n=2 Tax=Nyssorhynchus TaxID=44543 RepID=A0A2M4B4W2_9DIPT
MLNLHYFYPRHWHRLILVVWWCPVRQSLNLLAFYPLNTIYIDDKNYHTIHALFQALTDETSELELLAP